MGAGIVECDVTFTKDKELVCRHAQNDLHTTTNILVTPLASKCITPFTPAVIGADGTLITPASAECRTSDITLAEFKTLTRQDGRLQPARADARRSSSAARRTSAPTCTPVRRAATCSRHKESIELFKKLGVKMTPELKSAQRADAVQRLHAGRRTRRR